MAITPGWKPELVETEYFDKGAVTEPQINDTVAARFMKAEAEAKAADKVEWPTMIAGQTDQGM